MESRDTKETTSPTISRWTRVAGAVAGALILGLIAWLSFGITHVGSILMLVSLLLAAASLIFGWRWTARGMARTALFVLFGSGALIQLQVVISSLDPAASPVYEALVTVPVSASGGGEQTIRTVAETVAFESAEWEVADCARLWGSAQPTLTGGPDEELVGVILLAGADRRRLRRRTGPPSSNLELAELRAETVASCLREETLPIHVYTRAPGIEEHGLDDGGYSADRTVQVLGIWEPRRREEQRTLRVALQPVASPGGDGEPKLAAVTRPAPPAAGADSDGVRPVAMAEP